MTTRPDTIKSSPLIESRDQLVASFARGEKPAERWRIIQKMIAWADSQATVRRNTRERCLELQRAKLQS